MGSKVELSISCKGLKDTDICSKSDPLVVVQQEDKLRGKKIELGRTEQIKDCLSPEFSTSIVCDYFFEEVQHLIFEVLDIDTATDHDTIGMHRATLGQIVSSRSYTKELTNKKGEKGKYGTITIYATEISENASKDNL